MKRLSHWSLCQLLIFGFFLLQNACDAKPPKETNAAATLAVEKAAETHKNAEFPEEDSDMLMEPNDFTPITVLRSHEQNFHMPPTVQTHSQPPPPQLPLPLPHTQPQQFRAVIHSQIMPRADIGPHGDSHTQAAQNFYPPFYPDNPPLGHSRPYFPLPDSTPLPKYATGVTSAVNIHAQQRGFDAAILGSGDFGVLRGGTFYPEEEMRYHAEDNSDYVYVDAANNGHGRPSEEFIQKYTYPEEQFANFRDFADINTPADSAFSQFVVVYAARNATKQQNVTHPVAHPHPHPKNIFEQLELLDREKALEEAQQLKKLRPSKVKSKMSKTKIQKKYNKKKATAKEAEYEPLLALS